MRPRKTRLIEKETEEETKEEEAPEEEEEEKTEEEPEETPLEETEEKEPTEEEQAEETEETEEREETQEPEGPPEVPEERPTEEEPPPPPTEEQPEETEEAEEVKVGDEVMVAISYHSEGKFWVPARIVSIEDDMCWVELTAPVRSGVKIRGEQRPVDFENIARLDASAPRCRWEIEKGSLLAIGMTASISWLTTTTIGAKRSAPMPSLSMSRYRRMRVPRRLL